RDRARQEEMERREREQREEAARRVSLFQAPSCSVAPRGTEPTPGTPSTAPPPAPSPADPAVTARPESWATVPDAPPASDLLDPVTSNNASTSPGKIATTVAPTAAIPDDSRTETAVLVPISMASPQVREAIQRAMVDRWLAMQDGERPDLGQQIRIGSAVLAIALIILITIVVLASD
ncbi:MAG: hypothetical protein ACTHMX_05295, partial [Thermomicrobiales bacterium]